MVTKSEILLRHVASGSNWPAVFLDKILERHVTDIETQWKPFLQKRVASAPRPRQESSHWNWRSKVTSGNLQFGFRSFAIECDLLTQGVMIANLVSSSRLPSTKGKPLVYVEYVETAPWNRRTLGHPRFLGVGTIMMSAAIQLSREEDFHGRIGLHSLPQSEAWYTSQGMVCMGPDPHYDNLKYFEMTELQASVFSPEEGTNAT